MLHPLIDMFRVYGIAFPDQKQLDNWIEFQQQAALRDHRNVGKAQGLFFFHPHSPGSAFMLPHGARIYNRLLNFIKVWSLHNCCEWLVGSYLCPHRPNTTDVDLQRLLPLICLTKLYGRPLDTGKTTRMVSKILSLKTIENDWKQMIDFSDMFVFDCDTTEFSLKPMNCPGHCLMFDHTSRSYRELPIRFADFGVLHRNELAGALTGLTRVRRFQQDDAHIFCAPEVCLVSFVVFYETLWVNYFINFCYCRWFKMKLRIVSILCNMFMECLVTNFLWDFPQNQRRPWATPRPGRRLRRWLLMLSLLLATHGSWTLEMVLSTVPRLVLSWWLDIWHAYLIPRFRYSRYRCTQPPTPMCYHPVGLPAPQELQAEIHRQGGQGGSTCHYPSCYLWLHWTYDGHSHWAHWRKMVLSIYFVIISVFTPCRPFWLSPRQVIVLSVSQAHNAYVTKVTFLLLLIVIPFHVF